MNNNPITYELNDNKFVVRYKSPSRSFGNLRDELNNDVQRINEEHGRVYVAFSSGVDSQIILRCFLDMKADFEPFFIHVKGRNDFEYNLVKESEKFYGITIKMLELNLEEHKEDWLQRKEIEKSITLLHHPFEWASKQLPENFPMIMSGANEPAIIGNSKKGIHIYHNYYESLLLRFNLINQHRIILDFPYSAESLAAYYCDDLIKTWADVCEYYINNDLISSKTMKMAPLNRFNYYLKGLVKGQYFKKDILWPTKKTGYENYPEWTVPHFPYPLETSVSVNYNELVEHLESCSGTIKEFKDWNF
jgi:hypothetical protein